MADFFHAWQVLHPRGFIPDAATTRHKREVQDTDADAFSAKLMAVFAECHRVLKDDGLLVFSYHHSRPDGWASLAAAIFGAGFSVIEAHPVRAEMSVATPKAQASEPIQLDVLLVCRKRSDDLRPTLTTEEAWTRAEQIARERCMRLCAAGFNLSRHDRRVVRGAHFLACLGPAVQMSAREWEDALGALASDAAPASEMSVAPAIPNRPTDTPEHLELFA